MRTTPPTVADEPRRPSRRRIRESAVDRVIVGVVYAILIVVLLVVLIPILFIVASSFSSPEAVSSGQVVLWPVDFTLQGYQLALSNPDILRGFVNSFFYTVSGTLLSLILTVALAYPLSRSDFVGRRAITALIVFTMLFAGGLIPTYLVVQSLGMLNTPLAMIVPNAMGVWQVIIAVTFFRVSIPAELYESAEIDGASDLRILWTVVLPLSRPLLAVMALMYAIGQWNAYFDALIYLRDQDLYPLQLVLRNVLILNAGSSGGEVMDQLRRQQLAELLKYALIVVSSLPVLLIYPLVARHFTKGVMIGAVKG